MPARIKRHLRGALAWWSAGLLAALPERWATALVTPPDTVTVARQADKLVFSVYDGQSGELLEQRSMETGDTAAQAGVNRWLARRQRDLRLTLLLARDDILEKHLVYPPASAPELRALLAFEVERLTPFTREQVYFDYATSHRDEDNGRLHVDVYLALRQTVQQQLDGLRFLALTPTAVATDEAERAINLLPESARAAASPTARPLVLPGLLCLVLLITALYTPLLRYDALAAQLEEQVRHNRDRALQAQAHTAEQQLALERARFLSTRPRFPAPATQLLLELTRSLPDHTSVQQLVLRAGEVQVQGESAAAASIIGLIETSEYFEQVEFRSALTKSGQDGRERFHVAARLRQP
ncbi:MAG: hypothetical protein OXS28_08590 [Gammaproteobacteria bacterium]|nr:hypothetical protein [Gammaproteobacteria bacterium]MDE0283571.1 hypothetical protein [Gammaproteobacteria bacterium]